MATTITEISSWFNEGVADKFKYMLIICDSFDYEDYPVYASTDSDCLQKYVSPGSMQRVMEVYNLTQDKHGQLQERRTLRLPGHEEVAVIVKKRPTEEWQEYPQNKPNDSCYHFCETLANPKTWLKGYRVLRFVNEEWLCDNDEPWMVLRFAKINRD